MRKIFAVAVVFAVAIVSTGFSPADWHLIKTAEYEIAFPVKPTSETKMIPTQIGELKLAIDMYDASKSGKEDDNLVYMTNITEYPESLISSEKKENLPTLFRNAVDGAVKNVDGKLLSETDITIAGFPGREIKVDFKNGLGIIKARYYLVKNRMYIVQVITKTDKFPNASLDRFFSSFRVHTGR